MDYIEAADLIEQKLGKEEFYERVHVSMGGNTIDTEWKEILGKASSEAISVIPRLFFCPIITTNFDQIIEHIHKNVPDFDVAFPNDLKKIEQAKAKKETSYCINFSQRNCKSQYSNYHFKHFQKK